MQQPDPIGNDLPHVHDQVAADLAARKQLGIATYGQPLQPFNGRDPLRDLYEELLDACCYLKQFMQEREHHLKVAADSDAMEALAEAIIRSKKARLQLHLADVHEFGSAVAQAMADNNDLIQSHLNEHRNPDVDHDYQPWGDAP